MIKVMKNAGFVAALALPAVAQAIAVTPISGGVFVGAYADTENFSVIDFQPGFDSWVGLPVNVATAAQASVTDNSGGTVISHGTAFAQWASPTAGSIQLRNFGWEFAGSSGGTASVNSGDNWSYTFTPTTAGTYTMNYNVVGSGYVFGLWGFANAVDGNIDYSTLDAYNPNSSGTFTASLNAGQTYLVTLVTNANIQSGGDLIGAMDGDFDWTITGASVPEPANWAMMIAGFSLVGGALRSRRRVSVAA